MIKLVYHIILDNAKCHYHDIIMINIILNIMMLYVSYIIS